MIFVPARVVKGAEKGLKVGPMKGNMDKSDNTQAKRMDSLNGRRKPSPGRLVEVLFDGVWRRALVVWRAEQIGPAVIEALTAGRAQCWDVYVFPFPSHPEGFRGVLIDACISQWRWPVPEYPTTWEPVPGNPTFDASGFYNDETGHTLAVWNGTIVGKVVPL